MAVVLGLSRASAAMVMILCMLAMQISNALYAAKGDVIQADDKSFKEDVLKHPGVVIVEFYAPW
jgi:hypothetical protein